MDKFYIIANSEKDEGLKVSKRVAEYLENNGKHCVIQPSSFSVREPFTHYTDISTIPEDVECQGEGRPFQATDVVSRDSFG